MRAAVNWPEAPTAIQTDLGAIFVSLELSRTTWLITSLSPGGGEKMSKHSVRGGAVAAFEHETLHILEPAALRDAIIVEQVFLDLVAALEHGLARLDVDGALFRGHQVNSSTMMRAISACAVALSGLGASLSLR